MINKLLLNAFHLTQKRPFIVDALKKLDKSDFLIGAEVGTYRGKFAQAILDNVNIKKIYLIDPYEDFSDYKDYNPMKLSKAEREAHTRLKDNDKVIWIKKKSQDAPKYIKDKLDFVYLDGDHSYLSVKKDLKLFYPMIKAKGLLGGHDFYNGHCPEHDGVIQAVMEFAIDNNLKLYVQAPDWWVWKDQEVKGGLE